MPTHYGVTKLDITIDGTKLGDPQEAAKYEYDVVDQLRRVLDVYGNGAYKTDRWLMEELTKKLIIRPSLAHKSDASGNPVVDPQSHPVVITDLNASAESTNSNAVAPARIFGAFGLGSDVVIHYKPECLVVSRFTSHWHRCEEAPVRPARAGHERFFRERLTEERS